MAGRGTVAELGACRHGRPRSSTATWRRGGLELALAALAPALAWPHGRAWSGAHAHEKERWEEEDGVGEERREGGSSSSRRPPVRPITCARIAMHVSISLFLVCTK
jgi:hypothetical protein